MSSAAVVGRKKKHGEKNAAGGHGYLITWHNRYSALLSNIPEMLLSRGRGSLLPHTSYHLGHNSAKLSPRNPVRKPCTYVSLLWFLIHFVRLISPWPFHPGLATVKPSRAIPNSDSDFHCRKNLRSTSGTHVVSYCYHGESFKQVKSKNRPVRGKIKKKHFYLKQKHTHALREWDRLFELFINGTFILSIGCERHFCWVASLSLPQTARRIHFAAFLKCSQQRLSDSRTRC